MSKRHQKALSAPKTYPIARKEKDWVITPCSGPHPKEECIPLGIIVRDVLGYADSVGEVNSILQKGICRVDGRTIKSHRFPVGIFDVLSLGDENYRLVPSEGGFNLVEIGEDEATRKVCRIDDKNIVKGGKLQLNLNDGNNIEVDEGFDLPTGSSVVVSLPELEIEETIELSEGCKLVVTEGKNRGKVTTFKEVKVVKASDPNRAVVDKDGQEINLPKDLIFPVNEEIIQEAVE